MKKRNEEVPDYLGGLGELLPAEVLKLVNELLEHAHQSDHQNKSSNNTFIYVASGAQYVNNLYQQTSFTDHPQMKTADAGESFACDSYSFGLGGAWNINNHLRLNLGYFMTLYSDYTKNFTDYYGTKQPGKEVFSRTNYVFGIGVDYKF